MPGSSHTPDAQESGDDPLVPLRPAPGSSRRNTDDAPTLITPARAPSPSDPSLGLALGSHLGPFEILEAVGVGGMAAVLKARDRGMGRVVALKILPPHQARDGDGVTRFQQEARAAASLDHDNVARAFASGEDRGLHYIAFEFVEGENLRTLIERRGPIPVPECVKLMVQVAAGLAHAAERGVVHRDIKPSNIVVTPEGKAKIVDMGLARSLALGGQGGVTQSGVTLGTFDYISPEQALDPRRADVRSDIYSLGCAFYHASTGRPPVPDGTAARKLHFHQHEPVPDPRLYNPAIPDEFAFVLARMMAKDPAKRFQTAGELIATLAELGRLLHVPAEALAVDAAPSTAGPVRLLPRPPTVSRPVLVGVVAALAGLALVVALAGPAGPPGPTPRPFDPGPAVAKAADPGTPPPAAPPPPAPAEPTTVNAATLEQLAAALRNPLTTDIRLDPGVRYDFTQLPAGVVAAGKRLTIEPRIGSPGSPVARGGNPVLRVAGVPLDPANPAAARPMSLTFARPDQLTIRGVTVEVADGPPADPDADPAERPAGPAVVDAGRFDLAECRFEAARDLTLTDVAGLGVVATPAAGPTAFSARNTYFGLRRAAAVSLWGRVKAEAAECGFAPHPACFALRSFPEPAPAPGMGAGSPSGELALRSCSFLLDKGSAAEVETGGRWQVTAGYCVFAAPPDPAAPPMLMPPDMPERRPAVLRVLADRPDGVTFRGRPGERNAYFRVDPLALANRGFTFDEARRSWSPAPAEDAAAAELRAAPWAADPLPLLAGPEPWKALRLQPTQPALRVPRADVAVLGVKDLPRAGDKLYDPWPPAAQDATFDPRLRVVHPAALEAGGELPRNVYLTFEAAVAAAKADDTIQVRHDGPLEVPPTTLDNPKLRLTVKPYPGSTPVLTAPRDANRSDASLFRLVQGQLTFDGLEFRLKARAGRAGEARTLAVVAVAAGRECLFKDCTVTLEEREGGTERLAAVALPEAAGEPRPGNLVPAVGFERTLVRGRGRAVLAAARPFELKVSNSVLALAGPAVALEPSARATPAGGTAHLRFDQVTAVLGGPLVEFAPRPRDPRTAAAAGPANWVPAEVTTSRCLFTPLDGSPLVRLEGTDATTTLLKWSSAGSDWYAGFPPAGPWLEAGAEPDAPPLKSFTEAEWFAFTGDAAEASTGTVRFREAPAAAARLAAVEAAHLIVDAVDIPAAAPSDAGAQYAAMAATPK